MSALLDAIRRFWHAIAINYQIGADVQRRFVEFTTRGEIAEAPELPRTKTCPLNAEPHWCCDPAESDDEVIAAMEKQFPKTKDRRIR